MYKFIRIIHLTALFSVRKQVILCAQKKKNKWNWVLVLLRVCFLGIRFGFSVEKEKERERQACTHRIESQRLSLQLCLRVRVSLSFSRENKPQTHSLWTLASYYHFPSMLPLSLSLPITKSTILPLLFPSPTPHLLIATLSFHQSPKCLHLFVLVG